MDLMIEHHCVEETAFEWPQVHRSGLDDYAGLCQNDVVAVPRRGIDLQAHAETVALRTLEIASQQVKARLLPGC